MQAIQSKQSKSRPSTCTPRDATAMVSATPLMVHCHILEHKDAGMMTQFISV